MNLHSSYICSPMDTDGPVKYSALRCVVSIVECVSANKRCNDTSRHLCRPYMYITAFVNFVALHSNLYRLQSSSVLTLYVHCACLELPYVHSNLFRLQF